jgi:hypothetical protein
MKVFIRGATVSAARRFCIVFCEVGCAFTVSTKMSAEAELSDFDTERFITEVLSRIALWDMTISNSTKDAMLIRAKMNNLPGFCRRSLYNV